MMKKEEYSEPEFEILLLEASDVITKESVPWGTGEVNPFGSGAPTSNGGGDW